MVTDMPSESMMRLNLLNMVMNGEINE